MKFEKLCKSIINESKKKKEVVDGNDKEKPEVITEKDIDTEKENLETTEQEQIETVKELDETELNFFQKFLEFTEINALIKIQNKIKKDFKNILGKHNDIVEKYLEQHTEEQIQKRDALKSELTQLREEIQQIEKENVEKAERKLSIVAILDKQL